MKSKLKIIRKVYINWQICKQKNFNFLRPNKGRLNKSIDFSRKQIET